MGLTFNRFKKKKKKKKKEKRVDFCLLFVKNALLESDTLYYSQ